MVPGCHFHFLLFSEILLAQWSLTLFLEIYCPACFRYLPILKHLIIIIIHAAEACQELNNTLLIRIRCVGLRHILQPTFHPQMVPKWFCGARGIKHCLTKSFEPAQYLTRKQSLRPVIDLQLMLFFSNPRPLSSLNLNQVFLVA